ncbi:MAG: bifunctional histidinol-phosphatase/imidazoleglycerol-phosphate dehydratase HisB [Gammaproteobacteria bacterium]|nr:bifunctional histidinol-phosphatase/imidazoleglycerol-phosphate dehydratase HisB [Gammaproteobacteria bacterium]
MSGPSVSQSLRRVVFLDRDGTLVEEPADEQVDALEKIRLMPRVIPALLELRRAGFELVVVTNQDGLGTPSLPRSDFERTQGFIVDLFGSQGIEFAAVYVCPHFPHEACLCRKPGTGLLEDDLRAAPIDRERSFMVGDRDSDLEFATNLGVRGLRVRRDGGPEETWPAIARRILESGRRARVHRRTRETRIDVEVDLSQSEIRIATGIGFFDHMLEQIAKHAGFGLRLVCQGDLQIDEHHTVEDCALALGQALREALGDKAGIGRYGFVLPMDEAEARVSLDLCGRPHFLWEGRFTRERVGALPTELVPHFFRSLADALGASLHLSVSGENAHHMIESCFKGVGRSLRQALRRDGDELPSTKGVL